MAQSPAGRWEQNKNDHPKEAFHPGSLFSATQPSVPCRQTSFHPHSPDTAPNWPSIDPAIALTFFYVSGSPSFIHNSIFHPCPLFHAFVFLETSMSCSSCSTSLSCLHILARVIFICLDNLPPFFKLVKYD